jgi:Cu(I)/Ag(I) efflux system membrane protein CusA/SilA
MIARLIAWSARNLVLIFVGTVFAVAAKPCEIKLLI